MKSDTPNYRGYRFPPEVNSHAVWLRRPHVRTRSDTQRRLAACPNNDPNQAAGPRAARLLPRLRRQDLDPNPRRECGIPFLDRISPRAYGGTRCRLRNGGRRLHALLRGILVAFFLSSSRFLSLIDSPSPSAPSDSLRQPTDQLGIQCKVEDKLLPTRDGAKPSPLTALGPAIWRLVIAEWRSSLR